MRPVFSMDMWSLDYFALFFGHSVAMRESLFWWFGFTTSATMFITQKSKPVSRHNEELNLTFTVPLEGGPVTPVTKPPMRVGLGWLLRNIYSRQHFSTHEIFGFAHLRTRTGWILCSSGSIKFFVCGPRGVRKW